jgi:CheY-like chemotaxis protein
VRRTVLVCDDEEAVRVLVRAGLEGTRCTILEAADGDEALQLARGERPDLVLLDIMMPGRSGLEVASALRSDPTFASTPILFLSARTQAADRAAAARTGADYFVAKPFGVAELAALVGAFLEGPEWPPPRGF